MDDLVHFEEDFNSWTEKWSGGPVVRLRQTRLIPRSPDGDKKGTILYQASLSNFNISPISVKILKTSS